MMWWALLGFSLVAAWMMTRPGDGGGPGDGPPELPPAGGVTYDPVDGWGPSWGSIPPKDAPPGLRHPSRPGEALPYVQDLAEDLVDDDFADAMVALARNESGGTFGLPARRPYSIHAGWGTFQYNTGAWQSLGRNYYGWAADHLPETPWDATPYEELVLPMSRYAAIWRHVRQHGGDRRDAIKAVRLWHRLPGVARGYIDDGVEDGDWDGAWGRTVDRAEASNKDLWLAAVTRTEHDAEVA